jgi:hypothetical protein
MPATKKRRKNNAVITEQDALKLAQLILDIYKDRKQL